MTAEEKQRRIAFMQHKIATYENSLQQVLQAENGRQLAEHLQQEIKRMYNVIAEIERGTNVMYQPSPEPNPGPIQVSYTFDDSVQIIGDGLMPKKIIVSGRYGVINGNFLLPVPTEPDTE
jgi:predicted ribosome quality control (RQC) complex YloA/Tae2 family protein